MSRRQSHSPAPSPARGISRLHTPPASPPRRRQRSGSLSLPATGRGDSDLAIDSAHLCPICCLLLATPLRTACGHTFCAPCLATVYSGVPAAPPIDSSSELENTACQCPLCRETIAWNDLVHDRVVESDIGRWYPRSIILDRFDMPDVVAFESGSAGVLDLVIGNAYSFVFENMIANKSNVHLWSFFIRTDSSTSSPNQAKDNLGQDQFLASCIESVHIHLDSSSAASSASSSSPPDPSNLIILSQPPFEITRLTSRPLTLTIDLHFKPRYRLGVTNPVTLTWPLYFQDEGDIMELSLPIVLPNPTRCCSSQLISTPTSPTFHPSASYLASPASLLSSPSSSTSISRTSAAGASDTHSRSRTRSGVYPTASSSSSCLFLHHDPDDHEARRQRHLTGGSVSSLCSLSSLSIFDDPLDGMARLSLGEWVDQALGAAGVVEESGGHEHEEDGEAGEEELQGAGHEGEMQEWPALLDVEE